MATQNQQRFEEVSRLRGKLFEAISFGASVIGILALGMLLVYVAIDAFDLEAASPEWLLTYFVTLVIPYIGFCLYSANDREVTRRTLLTLGGGLLITAGGITLIETLGREIPRINWQLAYLFAVVIPMTGYVTVTGAKGKVGAVGFGFIGRLFGGGALGLWIFVLFIVFEPQMWYLVYTFAVLPAGVLIAVGQWRSNPLLSIAGLVALPVGFFVANFLRPIIAVYPTTFVIYLWTLVLPMTALVSVITALKWDRKTGVAIGGMVAFVTLAGSLGLAGGSIPGTSTLFLMLGLSTLTVTYLHRIFRAGEGMAGLALPLLLIGGALVGAYMVRLGGFPTPDPWFSLSYIQGTPTTQVTRARDAGFFPPIVGSVIIITIVAILSFVLGVGTAVFLEEYTSSSGAIGSLTRLLQVNIANLAAVPSVVYGLLGLGLFVNAMGLGLGTAVSASLTLSLLILPITVISAQEAIRSVPNDLRDGSLAMGATRWQTTKNVVLPEAMPGILTGVILALGRAIGETAPLIMIGMADIAFSPPSDIWSRFSAMPMMIFRWANNPSPEFRFGVVAAGVVTLLIILLTMNASAIIIRNKYERGS